MILAVLFNRLTLLVQKENEKTQYFDYELTFDLASFFREGKMRKPAKNVVRSHLLQCEAKCQYPPTEVVVLDAGDVLFQTSWNSKNMQEDIVQKHSKFIKDKFIQRNGIVVFGGNDR